MVEKQFSTIFFASYGRAILMRLAYLSLLAMCVAERNH